MSVGRVTLTPPKREGLERRARSRSVAVESVRTAKVILMLADGGSYSEMKRVTRWHRSLHWTLEDAL